MSFARMPSLHGCIAHILTHSIKAYIGLMIDGTDFQLTLNFIGHNVNKLFILN